MTFDQYILGILGVTALWLSQSDDVVCRKWAPVFGLMAQPFFVVTAWEHGQHGILALTVAYTLAWCHGIRVYWIKRSPA